MATTTPMTLPMPLQPAGDVHVLHPGDVVCAERGARLETLLGSCVAIVLTDPRRTVGAMCHIVHSTPAARGFSSRGGAYADEALQTMYQQLQARGIVPRLCEAYVYGGANMFPNLFTESPVGERNARWALQTLADDGVRVLAHDVGGQRYRKLSWVIGPQAPQLTMAGD